MAPGRRDAGGPRIAHGNTTTWRIAWPSCSRSNPSLICSSVSLALINLSTGMRPLRNYFPGDHTEADVAEYLQAALSGGNTLYMPQIPFNDEEAHALASFILTLQPAATTATAQAPASATVVKE